MSSRNQQHSCEERALLWDFVEGRLAPAAHQQIQTHLDECTLCRQELVAMQATRTLLSEASERQPSRRGAGPEETTPVRPSRRQPRFAGLKPGALVALIAGIGACLVAVQAFQAPSPQVEPTRPRAPSLEEEVARSRADDVLDGRRRSEREAVPGETRPPEAPKAPSPVAPAPPAGAAPSHRAPARSAEPAPVGGALAAAERLYLLSAQEGLADGSCEGALGPLEGFARGGSSGAVREKARLLRARCLRKLGRGIEADAEYRLYLQEYPNGDSVGEARATVAH